MANSNASTIFIFHAAMPLSTQRRDTMIRHVCRRYALWRAEPPARARRRYLMMFRRHEKIRRPTRRRGTRFLLSLPLAADASAPMHTALPARRRQSAYASDVYVEQRYAERYAARLPAREAAAPMR